MLHGSVVSILTSSTGIEECVCTQERLKTQKESILPTPQQKAAQYIPLGITPSGTGSLLMASFVFNLFPGAISYVSSEAATAFSRFM